MKHNPFVTHILNMPEVKDFDAAVSFLLQKADNGIRNSDADHSILNQILAAQTATSEVKLSLAAKAVEYAELARKRRAEMELTANRDNSVVDEKSFSAKLTGYFPHDSKMEGGFKDRYGDPLYTLQAYLRGEAPYVSVAADEAITDAVGPQFITIPALEEHYGQKIRFKIVDCGGAFKGKGTSRLDICTEDSAASIQPQVNAANVSWSYE